MLKEGYKWRIGDGSNIRVWNENWLRGGGSLALREDHHPHFTNLHVSDLMLPGTKSWNHKSLQNLLNSDEIEEMLKVPIFYSTKEDMRVWHPNKSGLYLVKTAYQ